MKTGQTFRHSVVAVLGLVASTALASPAAGQSPPADSLEQWIRRGYVLGTPESRDIWRELGWNGVGFGFRTFAARQPASNDAMNQSITQFATGMEFYRITLNEVQAKVDGDIGLAWGVHTEVFQIKGQQPESIRVRFTNTLRWNGQNWKNLLYHRDAQPFNANGRYIRAPR